VHVIYRNIKNSAKNSNHSLFKLKFLPWVLYFSVSSGHHYELNAFFSVVDLYLLDLLVVRNIWIVNILADYTKYRYWHPWSCAHISCIFNTIRWLLNQSDMFFMLRSCLNVLTGFCTLICVLRNIKTYISISLWAYKYFICLYCHKYCLKFI
jgi:hypothetical protein